MRFNALLSASLAAGVLVVAFAAPAAAAILVNIDKDTQSMTVTVDGVKHLLRSGDALFVPRGAVHRFDNLDAGEARAVITLTPAVAGKKYFEEIGAVANAGGPPDMAKVKAVMEKYGLIVA